MQTILREEALNAGDVASRMREALANIEKLKADEGVAIDEIDVTPFKEATAGVYDKLGYGELRNKLQAIHAK